MQTTACVCGAILSLACTGVIEGLSQADPGGDGSPSSAAAGGTSSTLDDPTPDSEGNLPYSPPSTSSAALQARTWKLTHEQYQRSVKAFLGVDVPLIDADGVPVLEPDVDSGIFRNIALSSFVSLALADDYHALAEQIAGGLTEPQIVALIPCGAVDATCRDAFLENAITKAFRRPSTPEDVTRFAALFDLANAEATTLADPAAGFRAVVQGLLTSPYFLYRTEIGSDAAQLEFTLTNHEVASFLSYSILNAPPVADLLAAAARGELTELASLKGAIESLLTSPEAAQQLETFMLEWLEVSDFLDVEAVRKDLPAFESVRQPMLAEARSFLSLQGGLGATLSGLLTAPLPLPQDALGSFYLSEASSASATQERTGLLALGAVLSTHAKEGATSPTLRGLFIRARLLCQDFEVPPTVPDISETQARAQPQTTRELYELHASDPACASCHRLIDGVGLTLENLDEMGRFRSMQNGVGITTTGQLLNTDVNRPLENHTQLAGALAESEWVRECLSRQVFRFYFGLATSAERNADGTREREHRGLPPIQAGRLALAGSGTLKQLLDAVLGSESTLARTRVEP